MFPDAVVCPLCKSQGKRNILAPIFAIDRGQLSAINPIIPDAVLLGQMFTNSIVKDLGYCDEGHGVIDLKFNVDWNYYRSLLKTETKLSA